MISVRETEGVLDALDKVMGKAIRAAGQRDIDEQQVAIARLADLATKLRAARDLSLYASDAHEIHREQAGVFAGHVAQEVCSTVRNHASEHGLDASDEPDARVLDLVREAVQEGHVRSIGRQVADLGGRNDWPLEETLELTRDAVREFAESEVAAIDRIVLCND